ncbi:MAG: winged helix-turn-helix transcriptional regulator [Alphaproteobacteria bacterium]|nr:winged helix-turn-helix transcriptional regulator [Alphaproteobacteria bacterium]
MKIDVDQMHDSAAQAEELLKAMANRHRLMILCQLIEGERSVGQLAEFLALRDANVSQHLSLLRKDGLVSTRRDGQTIWYAIASPPARKVIETIYQAFCVAERICAPAPGKAKR